jgi:hypothetical protein
LKYLAGHELAKKKLESLEGKTQRSTQKPRMNTAIPQEERAKPVAGKLVGAMGNRPFSGAWQVPPQNRETYGYCKSGR